MSEDQGDTGEREWGWDFGAILRTVPGVVELEAEGFTPAETLFGEVELATEWPEQHRRELRDTRFERTGQEPLDADELRLFLVRSPWSGIDLATVVRLMFRWVYRNRARWSSGDNEHFQRIDRAAQLAVVEEFFRQSEAWVRAYGKGRVNRLTNGPE